MNQIASWSRTAPTKFPVVAMAAVLVCSLLVTSCKKGDTGPAGPKGTTGSANVIYSAWVYGNAARDTTIDNSSLNVTTVVAPSLVDSIVNKGTILVYLNYGGGAFPMPYTSNAGGKTSTISFIPGIGKILVTRFTLDNSNSIKLSSLLQYRYILIPGGVSGGRQMAVDYSAMSYEQVCAYLQIPL